MKDPKARRKVEKSLRVDHDHLLAWELAKESGDRLLIAFTRAVLRKVLPGTEYEKEVVEAMGS